MSKIKKQEMRVHCRWMIRRDIFEVLEIERESFDSPWEETDFVSCLRKDCCVGMVAEHDKLVVGFYVYELHSTRINILNFAVDSRFRHRGIGQQMVEELRRKLDAKRKRRLILEVRETNLDAQLFFRKCGFHATSVLEKYYVDSDEDAYVMQLRFDEG